MLDNYTPHLQSESSSLNAVTKILQRTDTPHQRIFLISFLVILLLCVLGRTTRGLQAAIGNFFRRQLARSNLCLKLEEKCQVAKRACCCLRPNNGRVRHEEDEEVQVEVMQSDGGKAEELAEEEEENKEETWL